MDEESVFADSDIAHTIYLSPEAWESLQEYLNGPTPPPTEEFMRAIRRMKERRGQMD